MLESLCCVCVCVSGLSSTHTHTLTRSEQSADSEMNQVKITGGLLDLATAALVTVSAIKAIDATSTSKHAESDILICSVHTLIHRRQTNYRVMKKTRLGASIKIPSLVLNGFLRFGIAR